MNRHKIEEASETAQRRPANLTRPGRSASGQGLKIRAISEPRLSGNGRVDRPLRKLRFHNVPSANGPGRARISRRCGRPRLDRWRASKPMGDGSQSTHSCRSCPGREGMRRRATIGSTEGLRRRILSEPQLRPRADLPMPLLLLASSRGSLKSSLLNLRSGAHARRGSQDHRLQKGFLAERHHWESGAAAAWPSRSHRGRRGSARQTSRSSLS